MPCGAQPRKARASMGEMAAQCCGGGCVCVGAGEHRAGSFVGEARGRGGGVDVTASRASRLSQMWVRQAVAWRTAAAC